jgi:hypothetical protein
MCSIKLALSGCDVYQLRCESEWPFLCEPVWTDWELYMWIALMFCDLESLFSIFWSHIELSSDGWKCDYRRLWGGQKQAAVHIVPIKTAMGRCGRGTKPSSLACELCAHGRHISCAKGQWNITLKKYI